MHIPGKDPDRIGRFFGYKSLVDIEGKECMDTFPAQNEAEERDECILSGMKEEPENKKADDQQQKKGKK
jgi:hypothetical protein